MASLHTSRLFLAPLPGRKITSARGVSHSQSFYFVIVFSFLFLFVALYQKSNKISLLYIVFIFTAYFIPVIMTPEDMIFTYKQGSEESFKEAWSRINEYY